MALTRREQNVWDPFRELREMSERLNRSFAYDNDVLRRADQGQALMGVDWAPSVNISETDKAYMVRADLPEVKKEDVRVDCAAGLLTITGERKQEKTEENERHHRIESSYGRFLRRFSIPEDADEGGIEATFKDGALSVRIPKAAAKPPTARQIKIG